MKKWVITPYGQSNIEELNETDEQMLFEQLQSSLQPEAHQWEKNYQQYAYSNVYSITDCIEICKALTEGICDNIKTVLIPGCGSKTHLQEYIVKNYPEINCIYCTDWSSEALKYAQDKFHHDKVIYQKEDTSKLSFPPHFFDRIIIANSVLSGNDLLNRRMMSECYRTLKLGQQLYGLFPTIFCTYEMTLLDRRAADLIRNNYIVNIEKNTFKTDHNIETFYTPLRLKRICDEAGFKRKRFEICFFDSEYFIKENERIYSIPANSDLFIWELLIVVEK